MSTSPAAITDCIQDSDCVDTSTVCRNHLCVNLCLEARPCGRNAVCKVLDTRPVRTMTCVCLEGYEGDASEECTPVKTCPPNRGLIINEREECVCPPGYGFNEEGVCIPCREDLGFVVDPITGRCVCDSSRGLVFVQATGKCECPEGYEVDPRDPVNGVCVPGELES